MKNSAVGWQLWNVPLWRSPLCSRCANWSMHSGAPQPLKARWLQKQNRLVATELEKRRNNASAHIAELEQRLEEASALAPHLRAEQRQQLLALGDDLDNSGIIGHSPSHAEQAHSAHRSAGGDRRYYGRPSFCASQAPLGRRLAHRTYGTQEQDRLSQPHQLGGSDGVDARARFSLSRPVDCFYLESAELSH
jgi:hypothetical protein